MVPTIDRFHEDGLRIKELETYVKELELALQQVVNSHQNYGEFKSSQYWTGVVDGHRCAAKIARAALEKCGGGTGNVPALDTRAERINDGG